MEKRISVSISEGVANVRLVRADKLNALDAAMFDALVAISGRLAHEKGVRAVVLSGEGRAFCAGLDMGRFAAMKEKGGNGVAGGEARDLTTRTHGLANFPQQAVWGWRQLPVPVIAAVHGVAFGGGFELALGADMRFLAPDARMSIMESKWGLIPDMAGAAVLARPAREGGARAPRGAAPPQPCTQHSGLPPRPGAAPRIGGADKTGGGPQSAGGGARQYRQ